MANTKTPVSLLNEYMFRVNIIPQYDVIRSVLGPDPIFEIKTTVGNVEATGIGRNKKEAKHNSARKVLQELAKTDSVIRSQLLANFGHSVLKAENSDDPGDIDLIAASSNTEQVTENAVGNLLALCIDQKLPPPKYDIVEESGPAHCRNFVMHCELNCQRFHLIGVGQSGTKKQAKQLSAKRMIEKIKEYIEEPAFNISEPDVGSKTESNSVGIQEAKRIYSSIKKKGERGEDTRLIISKCHLNLQGLEGTEATALKNKNLVGSPEEILSRFAEEQRLNYSVEFTRAIEGECICVATLNTVPELTQFGIGPSESSAKDIASFNLLECLITMLD